MQVQRRKRNLELMFFSKTRLTSTCRNTYGCKSPFFCLLELLAPIGTVPLLHRGLWPPDVFKAQKASSLPAANKHMHG